MKFKAIIFDMDGTIIDTEHIWNRATRELIRNRGVVITPELDQELKERLNGMALGQSCSIIKEITKTSESVEQLVKEKSNLACSLYKDGVRFIEGFELFFNKIKQYPLAVGLATNADDATLSLTKQTLKLERFFGPHLYNISYVNNVGKPNPAIYLHTARQLEVDPQECIAFEDSAHGISAAQAAGMFCVGINSSKNPTQIARAHLKIEGYHEIDLEKLLHG